MSRWEKIGNQTWTWSGDQTCWCCTEQPNSVSDVWSNEMFCIFRSKCLSWFAFYQTWSFKYNQTGLNKVSKWEKSFVTEHFPFGQGLILIVAVITGFEINFSRQAPTGDQNFFQSPNGKMCSPKSVGKTFPLQRNPSQNYWLPWACRQNICNWSNQESNQCWNHLLTTLTDLHCHLWMPREYLNLHLISSRMFCLQLEKNYGRFQKILMAKSTWGLLHPQYVCYGKPLKKYGSEASHCS